MIMAETDYKRLPKGKYIIGVKDLDGKIAAECILANIRSDEKKSQALKYTLEGRSSKTSVDFRIESDHAIGELVLSKLYGSDADVQGNFVNTVYRKLGLYINTEPNHLQEFLEYNDRAIKYLGSMIKSLTERNLEEIVRAHILAKQVRPILPKPQN